MHLQTRHRLLAALRRPEVEVRSVDGVVLARSRAGEDDMLDLVHEDLDARVQTCGDGLVEYVLEALLLADDAIQEVGPVDVRRL